MKRYIEQLIDDLHARMQIINPPSEMWIDAEADPTNELELEDMAYVEQYIFGEKKKITEITGIDNILFPPAEKLNRKQQALLA